MFQLLDVCEQVRQKWQKAEADLEGVRRIQLTYENELAQARVENKELKCQLVESRSIVAGLIAGRTELERDRALLASQVDMVRDLLRDDVNLLPEYSRKKLQFLNNRPSAAVLPRNQSCSIMDISYDRTEESLDESELMEQHGGRNEFCGGKRSISLTRLVPTAPGAADIEHLEQTPRKRSRDDMHIPINNGRLSPSGVGYLAAGRRSPLNRSFSEPNNVGGFLQVPGISSMKSNADLATLSPATAAGTGRRHTFITKTTLKTEYCDYCEKRFHFAATTYRCEVCKLICHSECRELAMLPCIARGTPTTKNQRGRLVDFVPKDPPMVPGLIVHCINEIERRGLNTIGLYRIPGMETQVVELYEKFLYGRSMPNLRQVTDINILTSCVKKFLQQLLEPLIPSTSRAEFIKAAIMKEEGRDASLLFHQSIVELPQPNRDTLAFLMIHLQKVADYSDDNKMTIPNLAKVFGPTAIGGIMANLETASQELPKMEAVMKGLLELPPDYWGRFLSKESAPLMGNMAAAAAASAIFDNNHNQGACAAAFGPSGYGTTPKSSGYKTRNHQRKFFNPPWK